MAGALESLPQPVERVSTLELFFDLVFVFTATQLTGLLADDMSWSSVGEVVVMLAVIWWMYGGYAWLTNAVPTHGLARRALLLGGMAGYLVIALAVPGAFDGSGLAFGIGYAIVVAVHATLFIRSSSEQTSQAFRGLAPYNLLSAAVVLAGGALGGTAQVVLWAIVAVAQWLSPWVVNAEGQSRFEVGPAHFVERHGLVIIVAIGESVVAIGIGAEGLAVDAELVLAAVLGLLLSAILWWTYFGADDDAQAEEALARAPGDRRPWIALVGFGVAHYFLLLGIILTAVGLKKTMGHAYDELKLAEALALGGGAALFLAADVAFRRALGLGRSPHRAAAALLAVATVPLGSEVAAVAQLGAIAAVLCAALAGEGSLRPERYRAAA